MPDTQTTEHQDADSHPSKCVDKFFLGPSNILASPDGYIVKDISGIREPNCEQFVNSAEVGAVNTALT